MANRNSRIEVVKALLSKTTNNGCTEQEMLSSLAKARALMDTYNISDDELQLSREKKAALHDESEADGQDSHKIKWQLSYGVAKFCNVQIFRNRRKPGLTFIGFQSDIKYAGWLLDHLSDFIHTALFEFLLDHDCLATKDRREVIRGFVIGCTERVNARMIEMCEQSKTARTVNGNALVVIQDHAIKDFMKSAGIKLRRERGSRAAFSDNARIAGQGAGDLASFGRPISGVGSALRLSNSQ